LKKTSLVLLKNYGLLSFTLMMCAVLLLGIGATPLQAAKKTDAQKGIAAGPADINSASEKELEAVKATTKAASAGAAKLAPGTKINLNTADQATIEKLPGIGAVKAKAIIDGRPYKAIEDIMKIKGIKGKTFDALKDYIVVK
jgi:competence protein ComEA